MFLFITFGTLEEISLVKKQTVEFTFLYCSDYYSGYYSNIIKVNTFLSLGDQNEVRVIGVLR